MPYIKQERRGELDKRIDDLVNLLITMTAQDGDYNYLITRILAGGFDLGLNPKYSKINAIIGILECIKLELYRRVAAPYEDVKAAENGDVPEYSILC